MSDTSVCNDCRCAFCESEAQIVDLCPLHAAAPALLEALKALEPVGRRACNDLGIYAASHPLELEQALDAARDAIKLAE